MEHNFILTFICTIFIITIVQCIQFIENAEENSDAKFNTTTLYPVDKNTFVKYTTERTNVVSEKHRKIDRTTWKINTSFAVPKHEDEEILSAKNCKDTNHIKQVKDEYRESKYSTTVTKENNVDEDETDPENGKEVLKKYKENELKFKKEFKPSPHLNSYYDTLDDSPFNTHSTPAPTLETPTFFGSPRDQFKPHNNQHKGYVAFPYKYETYSAVDSSSVWGGQSLQSKPTIEAPVRIPAGGLYRLPDVLREKPNSYEDNDYPPDSIDNVKDNSLKKRANPWQSVLQLVRALLPVGLIVSALTPSILTIEDPNNTQFKRASRDLRESWRSPALPTLPALPALPAVSEDCKRRLLCEIHSDRHYDASIARRAKQCHKLRCEDPRALTDLLHWLLTYHRAQHQHINI
ncbi:PREDICTED: uncharacterized protein LOC106121830 [Papilio xuthus]|uniref:Uncharacterized protein LOC106121830 n=1 Tax=Papilio xuthus TaxID=66420 RepID=A0AAJ6ZI90_PAPXU|nr:PREDICTED: uncharacterized protein LOC106121830 [Papilio xuthus]